MQGLQNKNKTPFSWIEVRWPCFTGQTGVKIFKKINKAMKFCWEKELLYGRLFSGRLFSVVICFRDGSEYKIC